MQAPAGDSMALVLADCLGLDLREAAPPLARALRRPQVDVARALRASFGIPFEDLDSAAAEAAVAALASVGVASHRIPAASLPPLPRPRRAESASLEADEISLRLVGGDLAHLPVTGEGILLLSAAAIPLTREVFGDEPLRRKRAGDRGQIARRQEEIQERNLQAIVEVHQRAGRIDRSEGASVAVAEFLATGSGAPGQRLVVLLDFVISPDEIVRISSDAFEFRCLGEALASSTLANARGLISVLDRRLHADTPRADTWRSVVAGGLDEAAFASLESYHRWLRWRILLQDEA